MFRCPVVSRKHAKFAFYDGKLFLCDTESHHGTHIYRPGVSSTSTKLVPYNELQVNDGDVITFGKTVRNRELVKPVVVKVELFLDDLTEGARLEASSEDAYKESVAKAPITPITPTPALINVASTSTSTNTTPKSGTGRYGVFSPSSSESEGSSSSCEHSDEMDISSDSSASDASDDDDEVEEIPAPKPVHASASPASIAFKMLKSIGGGSFTSSGSGSGSGSPISSMSTPASWWNIGNGAAPPLPPPEPTTKPPPQPPTPPFMQSRAPTQTPFMFGSAAASQTHTPFTFGLGLGMGMGGMGLPRFFDPNGPGGSASAASIPRDVDENVCVTLPPLNLGPGSGFGGGEEGEGGDENENEGDHDDGLSSVFAVSGSTGASPSPSPYSQSPFVNPAASTPPSVAHATSSLFATSASPSMIALQRFKRMQKRMKLRELFTFKGFGNPSGSKEKGTGRSRSKSPMSMSVSESASTPSSPTIPSSFPEEQEHQQTGTSSIQCAQLRDGDVDIDAGVGGGPDNDGAGTLSVPVDYFADPIECGFGLDLDLDLDPWRVDPFAVGGVEDQEQDVPRDKGKGKAIVIDVEENRGAEDVDDVDDEVDDEEDDEDEDEDDEDEDDDVEFIGMGQSQEEQDSLFTDSVFARGAKLLPNATPATPAKSDPSTSSLPSTSAPPPTTKDDDSTADFIKAQLAINNSVADRLDTIQAKRKGIDDEINARDKKINDLIQGHRRDSDGIRASLHTIEEAFEKYQGGVKEIREDMEVGMEDMKGGLQEFRLELGGVGGRLGDVEDRVERLGVVRDRVDRLLERMDGVEMRVMEGDKVLRDGVGEAREQMGQMKRRVEGLEFDGEVWKAQTDEGKRLVEELRAAFERGFFGCSAVGTDAYLYPSGMQTEHQHLSEARESLKSEMRSVVEMRTRMEVLEEEWKAAIKSQMSTRLPLKRKRTDGSDDDYADDEDESTPSSKRIALDASIDQQITTPSPVSVPVPATNGDVQMTTSSLPRRSRIGRKIARTATTLVVGAAVTWTALAFS
ncbi:hypothetical protein PQX77_014816 [Marasmius sp. AFHP31]|nr:hypothetical protein PQX77_014816 [Marasmius sp. AFHP31]